MHGVQACTGSAVRCWLAQETHPLPSIHLALSGASVKAIWSGPAHVGGHHCPAASITVRGTALPFPQELASKRLAADQRNFEAITSQLLDPVWSQWGADTATLQNSLPAALEAPLAQGQVRKAYSAAYLLWAMCCGLAPPRCRRG